MALQTRFLRTSLNTTLRSLLAATTVLVAPSVSVAAPTFPVTLIQNYGWGGQATECTLCHLSSPGTAGTAVKPFAESLKARGLTKDPNPATLDAAMAQMGDTDSDGDGFADLEEIATSGDPNDPQIVPGGFVASEPVEYGCVGTIARSSESSSTTALVAAGVVAIALLRSRRRSNGAA